METSEKVQFQVSGIKWLYEHELLDDPQLINNLKMNILMASSFIEEVEFLAVLDSRQLLIDLELSWMGKKFFQKRIIEKVEILVKQLLPRYKIRVTNDKSIIEASRKLLLEARGS